MKGFPAKLRRSSLGLLDEEGATGSVGEPNRFCACDVLAGEAKGLLEVGAAFC